MNIKVGSINIPRYSCTAHKLNICVRKSILNNSVVSEFFKELSKFSSSTRHSIPRSLIHRNKKSKLRTDNATRWGSTFLMLESILKAHKRGAFNSCSDFPYSLRTLEIYYQILQPLYQFNVFIQRSDSTIADVIPMLLLTIHSFLERLDLEMEDDAKKFVENLIFHLKRKFQPELNSGVYYSAAILNVSKLSAWINRTFSSEYVKKSFKTLPNTVAMFMKREQNTTKDADKSRENLISSQNVISNKGSIYKAYMKSASVENLTITDGLDLNVDVTAEVELYFQTIKNLNLETISTKQFWLTHQTSLPILSTLAVKLLNIPSTSACIERYFSICGIICNKRNGNMKPELIIQRALLRANHILLDSYVNN